MSTEPGSRRAAREAREAAAREAAAREAAQAREAAPRETTAPRETDAPRETEAPREAPGPPGATDAPSPSPSPAPAAPQEAVEARAAAGTRVERNVEEAHEAQDARAEEAHEAQDARAEGRAVPRDRRSTRRPHRAGRDVRAASWGFGRMFAVVLAVLTVVGLAGAAFSLTQGPRATGVAVDAAGLVDASGQRVVFTLNQPVAEVTAEQVTIEPAAAFTLDTSGRNIGVQFTYALDRDTEYTVRIDGVEGAQGGPTSTVTHRFRTGSPSLSILQRHADEQDSIYAMNLAGDEAFESFSADRIEDFRAARDGLVVQTSDDDGASTLTVVPFGDAEPEAVTMPGTGIVSTLQLADRGGQFGYTYGDLDIGENYGIEAGLFLGSRNDPGADPVRVEIGEESRVAQWTFIPDTSYILALAFDGQLWLADSAAPSADPVLVGTALAIAGVEPGTARAIIERVEGTSVLDLIDLSEQPLVQADGADSLGQRGAVVPLIEGATLRQYTQMGEDGYPVSQHVLRVDVEGAVTTVFDLAERGDAVLQVCASPSGQYAAIAVTPDLVNNPYDTYARPLPQRIETHIVEVATGTEVTVVTGSDLSWCRVAVS